MIKRRILTIETLLLVGGCLAGWFVVDRMLLQGEDLARTNYGDKAFIALMEGLIQDGAFDVHGDQVRVNHDVVARRNLSNKMTRRVMESSVYVYEEDGRVLFDRQSATISNERRAGNETSIRGVMEDRHGKLLAFTTYDAATGKVRRVYPGGRALYPIIGHSHPAYGKRNLERILDSYLSGTTHALIYRNEGEGLGRRIRLGDKVILTIDADLQSYTYKLMENKRGAVVVLDVETGEILASVSVPAFDPSATDVKAWRKVLRDTDDKLFQNRAFETLYPPGSTFKTIVGAAWLDQGHAGQEGEPRRIMCSTSKNRYGIGDIHPHGMVDFDKAFAVSCNQFFSEIGVNMGADLKKYAERFGFNDTVNLVPDLKGVAYEPEMSLAFSWRDRSGKGDLVSYSGKDFKANSRIVAQGAIGQNLVMATPLQMAMVAETIANKGIMMNPFIVKEITTGDGRRTLFSQNSVSKGKVIERTSAERVARLMERVMEGGTGKAVKGIYEGQGNYVTASDFAGKNRSQVHIRVAGKTGTAEVGDRNGNGVIEPDERSHSWFIGFAPADHPRYAIAVVAENEGFGSVTAAPIAMDVLVKALNCRLSYKKSFH
jgi:penicillin-binding protein A